MPKPAGRLLRTPHSLALPIGQVLSGAAGLFR